MDTDKIAVVTGGNKGIGYAIVKGLCEKFEGKVYLTARDVERGQETVKKLNALGLKPIFHQLDVTNQDSINKLRDHLVKAHGGIDLLINNAGVYLETPTGPSDEDVEGTMDVNFFGVLRVCNTLFPILKKNARVINLSSSAGHLSQIPSEELKKKWKEPSLTIEELIQLINQFVRNYKEDKHIEKGWPKSPYFLSKVGCCALSIILQKSLEKEQPFRNISVNSVHPGFVVSDMTTNVHFPNTSKVTTDQGAVAPLYVALEDHGLRGKFVWFDKTVVNWSEGNPPLFEEN